MQGNNFPHNRCYMPYGGVDGYRTAHASSWKAWKVPSKYAGPKLSVWLDPARDLIVRRFEIADEDGTINVRQHDEVVQDRKGTWFANVGVLDASPSVEQPSRTKPVA